MNHIYYIVINHANAHLPEHPEFPTLIVQVRIFVLCIRCVRLYTTIILTFDLSRLDGRGEGDIPKRNV